MERFKVGDRVREKDGADLDLVGHWNEHWRNAGEYTGAFYVTSSTCRLGGRETITYSAKPEGAGPQIDTKYIEPAPLTIRAGAYYRTRDGRKVGPAKRNDDAAFPWNVPHGGFYGYTADGKSCLYCNEDDLIAEWVDEPAVANAVAVAEPKFKVGDRVMIVSACIPAKAGHVGREFTIQEQQGTLHGEPAWIGYPESRPYVWKSSELRLVAPATSGKFKVGDRVRHITEVGHGVDDLGIITKVVDEDVSVKWTKYMPGTEWSAHESLVVLDVESGFKLRQPAIVALIENGQPKPATVPFVHPDRDAAAKEAKRLADKHKGQEFGVYELVSSEKQDKVYEHEWQRLAVKPNKAEAIGALKRLAGITTAQARRIVYTQPA